MRKCTIILFSIISFCCSSQETKRVLFLGNSYTYYNDLPQLLEDVASSAGDVIIKDSNTPGGYTLELHSQNTGSYIKIRSGDWDFVVLQEQSQRPSLTEAEVETLVYPYARQLNDSIVKYNPCGETAFYMTWGRKNGDASNCTIWPPVCTYEGMDDLLRQRYLYMANDNQAVTSPVGAVWRYLRENSPQLELYDPDESHPSLLGSYAGAITFYTTFFRKNPNLVTYDAGLPTADAAAIKNAVEQVVFNNLSAWYIGEYDPVADFTYSRDNLEYSFYNTSQFTDSYSWDFGDGFTSTDENPIHVYAQEGVYEVTLTATSCDVVSTKTITFDTLGLDDVTTDNAISLYPNPTNSKVNIEFSEGITGEFTFSVFSTTGQKVADYQETIEGGRVELSNDQLANGLYFLIISNENAILQTLKFVKE